MSLLHSLQNHHEICEEIYRVMLELNRALKTGVQTPDDALFARQRASLATLDRALAELRTRNGTATPETRVTLEKCQRTIMKALLLDRENEQLLLKNAMIRPQPVTAPKPNAGMLARAYGRH